MPGPGFKSRPGHFSIYEISMSTIKTMGLAALTAFLFSCKSPPLTDVQALAECLRDSGATLYGTPWCGYCKKQKEAFGDSADLIPYVDCEAQPERCDSRIKGYPTWILRSE